jgi:hypothetical protein
MKGEAEAVELYEDFHRYPPRKIGAFGGGFKIPSRVFKQGKAVNVLYRSKKVDPETLRNPSKPVDYIHEHDSRGVTTYLTKGGGESIDTPDWICNADALVRLGLCLGFAFEDPDGGLVNAEGRAPLPELYATTNGKALLVIQGKRSVIAIVWGGKLDVEPRGIVG